MSESALKQGLRLIIFKAFLCALLFGLCALFALFVGDSDYKATMVGWLPLLVAIFALILAGMYSLALRQTVSFSLVENIGACWRNKEVVFKVRFKNKLPLYCYTAKAEVIICDAEGQRLNQAVTSLALGPFESFDLEIKVRFEHIGTHKVGVNSASVEDFLGLFSSVLPRRAMTEVQVLPQVYGVGQISLSTAMMQESAQSNRSMLADSLDYAMVREYIVGDPLKTIHWKLSARSDTFMTRLFEVYDNPGVLIMMDFHTQDHSAAHQLNYFDAIVEAALSLFEHMRLQDATAEIIYTSKQGELCREKSLEGDHLLEMLAKLPSVSVEEKRAVQTHEMFAAIERKHFTQGNVVVCSSDVSEDLVALILALKLQGRNPLLFSAIPAGLFGREREDYCEALVRLEAADIRYVSFADASELEGMDV